MNNFTGRYETMFATLKEKNQAAWIPFVMLGYPSLKESKEIIETFINNGADALEIGIPFSDPVADGVLIQEAARVALEKGVTVRECFDTIKEIREENSTIPFGLLTYANLVYSPGIDNFYAACSDSGIDSVLIADCPMKESEIFINSAIAYKVKPVFIAPPNASLEILDKLAALDGGYTYVVSRPGVTGDTKDANYPVGIVRGLNLRKAPPPVIGFGISTTEHVNKAVMAGFKGVISGSAITRMIRNSSDDLYRQLAEFSQQMKAATNC